MTTNTQGTRPSSRDTTVIEPTPVIATTNTGGVAVYDVDSTTNPTLRPSASVMEDRMVDGRLVEDRVPVEAQSTGSVMSWIIGAIVLIVLAYLLLQFVF